MTEYGRRDALKDFVVVLIGIILMIFGAWGIAQFESRNTCEMIAFQSDGQVETKIWNSTCFYREIGHKRWNRG